MVFVQECECSDRDAALCVPVAKPPIPVMLGGTARAGVPSGPASPSAGGDDERMSSSAEAQPYPIAGLRDHGGHGNPCLRGGRMRGSSGGTPASPPGRALRTDRTRDDGGACG